MKLQWDILLNDDARFPRLLFFAEFSDDRFRYGINSEMQYCLFFDFGAKEGNIPVDPVIRANISLEEKVEDGKPSLILTLLNDNARNLFNDLIVSIVSQTREIKSGSVKAGFISICNDWFDLFEPLSGQLTHSDLQGIFAELTFLKYLLANSRLPYNDILSAWKGPYGKGHDFELGENHFEVKGIAEFKQTANIASEYQLDWLEGQNLLLGVFEFSGDKAEQITIGSLVSEITASLRAITGTKINLFYTALNKAGIDQNALNDYDHHTFAVLSTLWYNCTLPGFPALKRSSLPEALRNIRYELALGSIKQFLIDDLTHLI
ncbi:PD-(D/E)XK motif protein [Mucilaginibacter sp. HD30]